MGERTDSDALVANKSSKSHLSVVAKSQDGASRKLALEKEESFDLQKFTQAIDTYSKGG